MKMLITQGGSFIFLCGMRLSVFMHKTISHQ